MVLTTGSEAAAHIPNFVIPDGALARARRSGTQPLRPRRRPLLTGTGCKTLVWYETHATMLEAIRREKQIKPWRRAWKLALIEAENPAWRDLSDPWFEAPKVCCPGPSGCKGQRRGRGCWVPDLRALASAASGMTNLWGEAIAPKLLPGVNQVRRGRHDTPFAKGFGSIDQTEWL